LEHYSWRKADVTQDAMQRTAGELYRKYSVLKLSHIGFAQFISGFFDVQSKISRMTHCPELV
jgi:hypothetical protein